MPRREAEPSPSAAAAAGGDEGVARAEAAAAAAAAALAVAERRYHAAALNMTEVRNALVVMDQAAGAAPPGKEACCRG